MSEMEDVVALWQGGLDQDPVEWPTEHGGLPTERDLADEYGRSEDALATGALVTAVRNASSMHPVAL